MKEKIAIIVAAGKSKRFNGLNKAMLPINGEPLIKHNILFAKENNYKDIAIVVSKETATEIISYIGNGEEFGVTVSYFVQSESVYGFPSAIYAAKEIAKNYNSILILCGDNYNKIDSQEKDFLNSKKESIKVFCKKMSPKAAINYAVLKKGITLSFIEKPIEITEAMIEDGSCYVYAGPLVVTPEIFEIIETLVPSDRNELEITDCINNYKDIIIVDNPGLFFDIGSELNYVKAISEVSK